VHRGGLPARLLSVVLKCSVVLMARNLPDVVPVALVMFEWEVLIIIKSCVGSGIMCNIKVVDPDSLVCGSRCGLHIPEPRNDGKN
jgi:hypothetical protein